MALKRKGFVTGAVIGAGLCVAALAGAGVRLPGADAASRPALIKTSAPVFAPAPGAPQSFADIFERVAPAVVSIDVTTRVERNALRGIPGFEGFPFALPQQPGEGGGQGGQGGRQGGPQGGGQQGDNDDDDGPGGQPGAPEAQATGSGFFISADGYIVTNNHVVENATTITVRLTDKRELKARLIGRDEGTDLAVIKVEGGRFPFVNFENDAKPRVGDWVIAVGNPFNLGGTATAGIVSAYGRDIGEQFVDYLQIDAPINRGNSGGPTFDVYGGVIGVNTAIFSQTGGSVGIGFAVPSDIADSITKQLIAGGKITRGYLGVSIQSVNKDIADSLSLPADKGALVNDVTPGGPADKAGVMSGDVVLQLNGKPVPTANELTRMVASAKAGETLRLQVLREGKTVNLNVTSGTRPSNAELAQGPDENNGSGAAPRRPAQPPEAPKTTVLGIGLVPIDDAARRRFSIAATVRGVAVDSVTMGSDAATKGLRRGDVIVQANTKAVTTPAELEAAVAEARKAKRPSILLLVNRGGRNIGAMPLKLDEDKEK